MSIADNKYLCPDLQIAFDKPFSRDMEKEADVIGLSLAAKVSSNSLLKCQGFLHQQGKVPRPFIFFGGNDL